MAAQSSPGSLRDALRKPRSVERLRRLHAFLARHLDLVTAGPFDDAKAKAACEIALYCGQLRRWAPGTDPEWRASVLDELAPVLRSTAALERLLWAPAYAGMYGLAHALLVRGGSHDPRWDRALRTILALPAAATREALPYERLEEAWCRGVVGAAGQESALETPLDRGVHPLWMAEADAYAYTHAVLYASDFGERPLPSEPARRAAATIDAGVVWSLARGDFDLLGEFLLCSRLVCARATPAVAVGLAAWAATFDALGLVPDRAAGLASRGSDERASAFFGRYHANLVAGLLSAALCRGGPWLAESAVSRRPEDREAQSPGSGTGPRVTPAEWLEQCAGAEAAAGVERWAPQALEAIAPDLAIQLGFHSRDLGLVATGIAAGCNRPPWPTWLVAVEWLAAFDGCLRELGLYERAGGAELSRAIEGQLGQAARVLLEREVPLSSRWPRAVSGSPPRCAARP